jgi:hypothetical protein
MTEPDPSGFLSLNILFKNRKGTRLCQTNCRSIEVTVLYPTFSSPSSTFSTSEDFETLDEDKVKESLEGKKALPAEHPATMSADQEQLSPITSSAREDALSSTTTAFPLMRLPLELRLKIYGYLLPPRHHKIVTQLPHNGFFYNSSAVPLYSAQSFYPFGTKAPNNLTTYKVLTSNTRSAYPYPSIYPELLRVSRQIKREAEPILYGSSETVWDFGVHLEALKAFWGDRSAEARRSVRGVRVAREIPCLETREGTIAKITDGRWVAICEFLKSELVNLRTLDLTIWSSSGSTASFPVLASAELGEGESESGSWVEEESGERERREEEMRRWREWEWTADLLKMDALRQARITWWGFENGEGSFDSWLAGRMVGDQVVRERIVREGGVVEGRVVLRGLGG